MLFLKLCRGGSRGRVQGVCTPPPSWDDLRFSNTTGILQKKKLFGLLVLKVEQETSAPPPTKNLGSALVMYCVVLPWHPVFLGKFPMSVWSYHSLMFQINWKVLILHCNKVLIDMKYIWNNSFLNCGCRWKWRMIIAVNFPI